MLADSERQPDAAQVGSPGSPLGPSTGGPTGHPPQFDRRQARRFASPGERREARLRSGDRDNAVQLLDESATGFAVLCDTHPGVFEGETVWLKTVAGWESASVVSVSNEPSGVRIGLRRVSQQETFPKEPKLKDNQVAELPSNRLRIAVGLTLVFTLVSVPLLRSSLLDPLRVMSLAPQKRGSPDGLPLPEPPLAQGASIEEVLRYLGPRVFSKAEVRRVLKLSPQQISKLHGITNDCNHAVNMAVLGGSPYDTTLQLKQQAYRESLAVLTDQQRQVWAELVRLLQNRPVDRLWQQDTRDAASDRTAFD